jgi:hypothetical protein
MVANCEQAGQVVQNYTGETPGDVASFEDLWKFTLVNSPPFARYAQKTIAFHFEFGSDFIENARYEMQTLYSMENLEIANQAFGRC